MSVASSVSLVAFSAAFVLLLAIVGFGFTSISVQIDSACSSFVLTQEIANQLRHVGAEDKAGTGIDINEQAVEEMLLQNADRVYKKNMIKRAAFLNGSQPLTVHRGQMWLGLFVPGFPCPKLERIGSYGDGGKWVCNMRSFFNQSHVNVISVGSHMQYSFEQEVYDLYGSKPYTFDPFLKPWQNQHMGNLSFLHFHQMGLAASSEIPGLAKKYPRKPFGSFQQLLKLTGRSYVDILKVDCEGCEFKVLEELSDAYGGSRKPPIGQLTIEIHSMNNDTLPYLYMIENMGFRLFHMEANPWVIFEAAEYSFIHESLIPPPTSQEGPTEVR